MAQASASIGFSGLWVERMSPLGDTVATGQMTDSIMASRVTRSRDHIRIAATTFQDGRECARLMEVGRDLT